MMMKVLLFLFYVFLTNFSIGQEKYGSTFRIVENPGNSPVKNLITIVEEANFDCYRFYSKERILTFRNGVVIALNPFNEFAQPNTPECYLNETDSIPIYVLEIINGQLMIEAPMDKSIKIQENEK